jgi:predicted phage tail protein
VLAEVPGEPACEEIKWFVDNRELVDDVKTGLTIDNKKEYRSELQIDVVSRKDSGVLTCEAVNCHGTAKTSVQLIVYGKPGPPEDRLLVSDITASGCRLNWQPTKNSGGLPIEYLVEKYTVASDTWTRQGLTSNTDFAVNDLETNKEYEFRVLAVNEIGESEGLSTGKATLAKNQYTVSLPPSQPQVIEWNERCMTISWTDPIDDGGMPVTGYSIEARRAGGQWQIWETLDTKENRVVMQKLQKGQEYQFRVIAVNKAGKSEPSHPSRPKLAKETDLLPYIDAKTMRDVTVEAKERLKFEVAIFGEPTPEVTWYKGDQSVEELGDKSIVVINTDSHSKIVFNNITRDHAGNYSIVITNKSGDDSAKVSVKVLDRPDAPESPIKATIEEGAITLLWKKVKYDGGSPIETYQVEKTDNEKNTWAACGHTQDNTITIPGLLGGLTYKFRICAVNKIGDSDPLTSDNICIDEDALTRGL